MVRLKALKLIKYRGKYAYPDSVFSCDKLEAERLRRAGVAELTSPDVSEQPADDNELSALIKGLKVEQLKSGLDDLQIGYLPGAKKGELQQALLTAAEANPIQWNLFLENQEAQ